LGSGATARPASARSATAGRTGRSCVAGSHLVRVRVRVRVRVKVRVRVRARARARVSL